VADCKGTLVLKEAPVLKNFNFDNFASAQLTAALDYAYELLQVSISKA